MRATEIIRGILDVIDQAEARSNPEGLGMAVKITKVSPEIEDMPLSQGAEEINRFKQIVDLLPDDGEMSPLSNSPNPKIADIDAITKQSGDDMHKSKNPADIRSNATSMYPFHQHRPE